MHAQRGLQYLVCVSVCLSMCVSVTQHLASFPGPKRRRRRKGLVSAVCTCANRGGIPPPPHTIDVLPYACDANIDTKRNTVRRFMVAKYGTQETHSIVLIQQTI